MIDEKNTPDSREFAESIINTVREPLISLDQDLRVVTANRSFYEFFKVKPEETVGQLIYDLGNKQWDIPKLRELLETILPQKSAFDNYEVEHNFTTIGRRTMLLNARQIVRGLGKERIILLAIEDTTERKRQENLLSESEERFRRLFETANDGILLLEKREMKIRHANPAITAMLGYSNNECIGKEMKDIGILKDIGTCEEVMQALNKDGIINYKDVPVQTKAGQVVDTDIYMVDRAKLFQCNIRDITGHKEAKETLRAEKLSLESQLIQAQKMESIGRLAGGVAHDFNNMLSVILGYGQMISEMTQSNNPLHEYAQEILAAGVRSANITRQLLAFARKQIIVPEVIDLNETLEDMLKMLRRLIGEDINLVWLPASVWPVNIDPSQLDQILANLCVNARDAIDGVGAITIETAIKTFDEAYCSEHPGFILGDFTLFSVSDDGCGMDKDVQSKVFEPFFTTKELGEGTGLGLSTVYGIVKQNNGFINVYSEPGKGTTFRIYLPRHNEQENKSEKHKVATIPRGQGETLLVVEDEAAILKLTAKILNNLGYVVITANSPKDAVNLVKGHCETIDLIITDVIMPEMNGRDLVNVLLTIQPNMTCLFMSGYTSTVIASQGVLAEGMQFIQKPFSANDLATKVHGVLKSEQGKKAHMIN